MGTMNAPVANPLSSRRPWQALAKAYARVLWTRKPLPPGDLVDIGELERGDRTLLIDRAAQYGPVFKGLMDGRVVVCVLGHDLGRRLLKERATSLRPLTVELESLFPHGFMRGMEGEVHRDYRRALVQGVQALDLGALSPRFEGIASDLLAGYAADPAQGTSPQLWASALAQIAASSLITLFFGVEPCHPAHARLLAIYHRLGPHGVVWHITRRQADAYEDICLELASLEGNAGGLLGRLQGKGPVDATLLGNLVYMVELGRYDLRGLLRWVSRYAAEHATWMERILAESADTHGDPRGPSAAEAFVLETLRMDQSERLMRDVKADFIFEGWLVPSGSLVRVCMWEAHKEPMAFPQPFEFNPGRFLGDAPAGDWFSPFGLDHHHCPLAVPAIQVAIAFVRALARGYIVCSRGAEPAVRGPYHWEPSPRFEVALEPRATVGARE